MRRSMDWTLENNMADGFFFCATLTGRRGSHTPFVQAGAETSVKPHPGFSWEVSPEGYLPVSGMKMRSLVGLSALSAFHWWSAQCAARMLLLSDKLMSCYVAGTNGCLDLRRRAFALDGQVSVEWRSCPGPMAGLLETVWLYCDEAQQVGCLWGLEGCPLVSEAGIQTRFARRGWWQVR